MLLRYLPPVIAGILAFGCKPLRQASNIHVTNGKEIGAEIFPAVVPLYKSYSMEENQTFSCTGTFLTPKIILTAAHCVKGLADEKGLLQGFIPDRVFDKAPVQVLRNPNYKMSEYNPEHDLGLIRFEEDVSTSSMKIREDEAKVGDELVIVGFGRHDTENADSAGKKRIGFNKVGKLEDGLIQFDGLLRGGDFSGADAASSKGDSGGPMFVDGELVGVTSGGYTARSRKFSNYVNLHSEASRTFFKHAKDLGFDIPLPKTFP